MSKQVDERVLSMRFDNKQFETNVATTMSTLDKLKAKLNLKGASKGLDNIQTSAKNVNLSPLASGVEAVHAKFSALEVMGVTALANITNSAVNAGKRIVSALTIDPIKTGFSEYETQIDATQTILANVGHKGKTLDDVNAALDELNKYADQTIYNFTEMTRNIGLFTNAGVGLDESVSAIKGFSNAAAMAGTDATRTAGAMYQLSQAMSSGSVKLMDWRSLEQANITGERFQETIKITARAHGIAIDSMIKKEGSLRETLKSGWLTADLMSEALNHYTLSTETMSEAEIAANKERLKSIGYTDEQIESLFQLGTEATNAATKVKTFSQLWGVLQESAQSGWSQTWKLIIGDFEEAKNLLTPLANFFTGIIDAISTARNRILEIALDFARPWSAMVEKLGNIKKAIQPVSDAIGTLESFQDVVTKVWRGDFNNQGDNPDRRDLLRQAGWDPRVVQTLVNLGYGYSLTMEDVTAAHEKFGLTLAETGDGAKDASDAFENLTDQKLKDLGLTDEEIRLYRALEKEAKRTGMSIAELADEMSNVSGRDKLINSFKNIGSIFTDIGNSIKEAFTDIFDPPSLEELGIRLYGIVTAFENFTEKIAFTDEETDKLKRTFKGLFAALDIILTIVGGPIKIVFKILGQLLGAFDLNILDVTAVVGDAIVKFRDWLDSVLDFTEIFQKLAPYFRAAASAARDWFSSLKDTSAVSKLITVFNNAKQAILDWINGLKEADNIGQYIIDGLINGLGPGAGKVIECIRQLGERIIAKIKEILGIHSPSTVFMAIGGFIIAGLIAGLLNNIPSVNAALTTIKDKLVTFFEGVDFGAIFAGAISVGVLAVLFKLANAFEQLTSPLEGIGDVLTSASKVMDAFRGTLKSFSLSIKANAFKSIAISLAILVGAIAVLTLLDTKKVWAAVGVLLTISVMMVGLAALIGKLGPKSEVDILKFAGLVISLGVAIGLMSIVMKMISKMSWEDLMKAGIGLAGLTVLILGLVATTKIVGSRDITDIGYVIIRISAALLLLSITLKIIAGMTWDDLVKAGVGMAGLTALIVGLMAATRLVGFGALTDIGNIILKISAAIALLAITLKIIAGMTWEDLIKAGVGIAGLTALIVGLMAATRLVSSRVLTDVGGVILGISAAILLLSVTLKIIATMSWEDLVKAGVGITGLSALIVGLIAATRLAGGNNLDGVAKTLLSMALAIGVLAGVIILLGLIETENLLKGTAFVTALGALIGGLLVIAKDAGDAKDTLIGIAIAIAAMVLSIVTLSFVDPKKLLTATSALTVLMGSLALILKSASGLKGYKGVNANLIVVTVIVAALAVIVYALSKINPTNVIPNVLALSTLLLTLAGVLKILNTIKVVSWGAVGALAVLGVITAALTLLLWGISKIDSTHVIPNVIALSTMLLAMSAALVILKVVGMGATAAFAGMGALAVLIVGLTVILGVIGGLVNKFESLGSAIDTGVEIFGKLGTALGSFFGNIVGGFMDGVGAVLPSFGQSLSDFMENAQPFFDAITKLDSSTAAGVAALAGLVIALAAASFIDAINSVLSIFTGDDSMSSFGEQLVPFGESMVKFSEVISGKIDESAVTAAANAGTLLAEMARTIPNTGGLVSLFTGDNDLASFGEQLVPFGESLVKFSSTISGKIDEGAVTAAANACSALTEMARTIPNTGGLVSFFTGDNDLATFGQQLIPFGESLVTFSSTISGNIDEGAVTAAANAGTALAEMARTIPNTGGLVSFFTGDNDMTAFGEQLEDFGYSIAEFSNTVSGKIDEGAVTAAANAGAALAEMARTIPNTGGLVAFFTGDNDMSTFGDQLEDFGYSIVEFSNVVSGNIDESAVTAAANAGAILVDLANTIPNTGGLVAFFAGDNDMATFGEDLVALGEAMTSFSDEVTGIDPEAVVGAADAAKSLVDIANSLDNSGGLISLFEGDQDWDAFSDDMYYLGSAINDFYSEVDGIDPSNLDGITDALNDLNNNLQPILQANYSGAALAVEDCFRTISKAFSEAYEVEDSIVERTMKKLATLAYNTLKTECKKFENIGKFVAQGLANGIDANTYLAEAKARAMAKAASDAAKEELDEHSPSKVFYKIGAYAGQGLVNAFKDYSSKSYESGAEIARSATNGLRNSISRISDAINSDIDAQPTIRPVLDLSDVASGAGAINGMFNMTPSVGVLSNVRSIGAMMNGRQNGGNADIISAIDDLKSTIGGMSGNTYQINGITYDDGSNINSAVETLVRAARIERRV